MYGRLLAGGGEEILRFEKSAAEASAGGLDLRRRERALRKREDGSFNQVVYAFDESGSDRRVEDVHPNWRLSGSD